MREFHISDRYVSFAVYDEESSSGYSLYISGKMPDTSSANSFRNDFGNSWQLDASDKLLCQRRNTERQHQQLCLANNLAFYAMFSYLCS